MDLQLKGKKVLVTGSTAGIGFATARALAAEDAAVIVNGRGQPRVDAAIAEIRKSHPGASVSGIASDVSNAAGCAKLIKALADVDILVNNMGIFEPIPFEKIPDEDWMRARLDDVLNPAARGRVPVNFRTDGVWVWSDAAHYYVYKHGVSPDPGLLEHIRANGPRPGKPDALDLFRALAALTAPAVQ